MEEVYRCLHQVSDFGVSLPKYFQEMLGMGDCKNCAYDPMKNPNCVGYSPVKVFNFFPVEETVEEGELEKIVEVEPSFLEAINF